MKILYSLSSDGLGHTNRSSVVIDYLLSKGYEIIICVGKKTKAYEFLKRRYPKQKIYAINKFRLIYKNNEVKEIHTFLNLFTSKDYPLKNLDLFKTIICKEKPNLIISDFEPFSVQIGKLYEIPIIAINHQDILNRTDIEFKLESFKDYLLAKLISKLVCPYADKYFIISFYKSKIIKRKTKIFDPLLKNEILNYKPKNKDYIFVYYRFSKSQINKIQSILEKLDNERFIFFGFNISKKYKNIEFKKDNPNLYKYLADSKAVICNGGHTLITEAIYYKKPIYSVPVKNQFEQISNSYYLEKLGFGEKHDSLNYDDLNKFLQNIKKYKKKLKKHKYKDKKIFFKYLEKTIKKLIKKKKKNIIKYLKEIFRF
jgi:uncharacterized protein (TIGR00661 family)